MTFSLTKLLQQANYETPPPEAHQSHVEDFYGILKACGYKDRPDTRETVETAVAWFAQYAVHRKSVEAKGSPILHKSHAKTPEEWEVRQKMPIYAPPKKGLLLFGGCGTGKTMLLRILSAKDDRPEQRRNLPYQGIPFYSSESLVADYQEEGEVAMKLFKAKKQTTLIIDELGGERFVKVYGSDPIINDMLIDRYKAFQWNHSFTLFATNLSLEDLQAKYSERIVSRLHEMCEFVPCIGEDWRKRTA